MLDRKIKSRLAKELEVPQIVSKKVKFTLDDIRLKEFGEEKEESIVHEKKEKRMHRRWVATAAAACALLVSSITVTAAVTKWMPDFMQRFQISEDLQEKMSEEGVSYTPLETIEQDGMSVSLEQCLTDNEYFYCLFKVVIPEGIEGEQFENISVEGYKPEDYIECDGLYCYREQEEEGEKSVFYYMISGKHMTLKNQDIEENADETYAVINESCVTEEDYKKGYMTFRFENYGAYDKDNQFQAAVSGEWEFKWAEKKVEDKMEYGINKKVGKGYYTRSKAVLKEVTVSPIVMNLVYELPEDCPDEIYYLAKPTEVELADGTRVELQEISSGYEDDFDEGNNDYKYAYGLNLVRNPEDIVAIYFGENERIELR